MTTMMMLHAFAMPAGHTSAGGSGAEAKRAGMMKRIRKQRHAIAGRRQLYQQLSTPPSIQLPVKHSAANGHQQSNKRHRSQVAKSSTCTNLLPSFSEVLAICLPKDAPQQHQYRGGLGGSPCTSSCCSTTTSSSMSTSEDTDSELSSRESFSAYFPLSRRSEAQTDAIQRASSRCEPTDSELQDNIRGMAGVPLPSFADIVNVPAEVLSNPIKSPQALEKAGLPPPKCVMCLHRMGEGCIIRSQNKGVCSNCDSGFWLHERTGMIVKWCKGCKKFGAASDFSSKVWASKCNLCRGRVKRAYAKRKENRGVMVVPRALFLADQTPPRNKDALRMLVECLDREA
jgi:hypothetical protein